MSFTEIKQEIVKLSPEELNQLWEVIEDALDNSEADKAVQEGNFSSLETVKNRLGA